MEVRNCRSFIIRATCLVLLHLVYSENDNVSWKRRNVTFIKFDEGSLLKYFVRVFY
jgi:hypothetical protein